MEYANPVRPQHSTSNVGTPRGWLRRLHPTLPVDLAEALWLFVTLRVAFSAFAFLLLGTGSVAPPCARGELAPILHDAGRDFRLLGVWQRWDACWYERIATLGYQSHPASVGFFPLYPALMRVVGVPFGGHLTLAGILISSVAYIAAMIGLYRLVCRDFDAESAQRAVLYLSVFPSAFFLFAPFTEALFLALSVWVLYAARQGHWGVTAPLALLAGLTRIQGALLALPLAWEWWRQRRHPDGARRRRPWAALVPALPPSGFLLFLLYSEVVTGATAFQAQRTQWGVTGRWPWTAVITSWREARAHSDPIEVLNLASLILFSVLLIIGVRRIPLSYALYAAPQLLLMGARQTLVGSPLASTYRYVLVLFPAFVVLAWLGQRRRLHYAWLCISLLLLGWLLSRFLGGAYAY